MTRRIARWLGWSLFALAMLIASVTIQLVIILDRAASTPGTLLPPLAVQGFRLSTFEYILGWTEGVMRVLPLVAFSAMGALIVSRYPTHAIGWMFCMLGIAGALEPFGEYYALVAVYGVPGTLPGGPVAAWIQNWIWVISISLVCAFLPLLFPTGRLASRRWKPLLWIVIGTTAVLSVQRALEPGLIGNFLVGYDIMNPLGVARLRDLRFVLFTLPLDLLHASMVVAAASLVVRLRNAQGVERQQIKWFVWFGAAVGVLEVLQFGGGELGLARPLIVSWAYPVLWPMALTGLALAAGLAILRYHLWDIDVIIRRTLIYGTLSAVLGGLYFGIVIGAQAVVQPLTGRHGQQPAIIVATTLLIAALFNPLRRGVQAAIDRSFYRRKYDAARALHALGVTLRGAVELNELSARMLMIVQETMQPAHLSLWLRPPERQPQAWQPELSHLDGLAEGLAPNALRAPLGGEQ